MDSSEGRAMTQNEKPWKGVCCRQCWTAKGKRCRCKCRGKFHQSGLHKHIPDYFETEEKEKASQAAMIGARSLIQRLRGRKT